ncbi:MAG: hypothetical protein CMIDDMOC_00789 [Sodalis sp. Fle]|nr:MAG: hypothetical protein CMIDDMOC_00789 [Sodalis sp. Fle]
MLLSGLMKNFALMELAMLNKYSCRQFFPSLNIVQPSPLTEIPTQLFCYQYSLLNIDCST